ncbi:acyl-CoA thioesterase [Polymorphum gilvum]|uniref:Thioesterase family protein n=1 Tax=Polymorphum gilvum (strain LMG 25793 / CGMCC 1.9160 / SL003B-26A1) TaxID=991905 RepID=F2IW34_POLGS|nr:Thioesterase family protein [Polymorphum gilvum SL003B-26A1]
MNAPARSRPLTRADFSLFRPIPTRWLDVDIYGHVNNVVYLSYFDTAVNGWYIEQGLMDPASSELVFLVVETGCQYFAELAFPDLVQAGIRVAALGTSSVRYDIALFRNDDATAAAQGQFVHVQVDRTDRRPRPIAGDRRAAFEALLPRP